MTTSELSRIIGLNVRAYRKRLGLTLPTLSEQSKVAKGTISQLENGKCNTTLETLCRLALHLCVEPAQLLEVDHSKLTTVGTFRVEQFDEPWETQV